MKKLGLFLVALYSLFSLPVQAETNVLLGKPVSLVGAFGTGSGYLGTPLPPLPPASMVTDGIFQGGYWTNGVWWDEGHSGTHNYVQIDLQGTYTISSFSAMVDNNDPYLLEYKDTSGNWQTAWNIPEVCCFGLTLRSTTLPAPITATELRLSGIFVNTPGHDMAFSVSEIQAAVPEPETWVMMLLGSGLVGWQVRRKARA